jgi:hypothetical protein
MQCHLCIYSGTRSILVVLDLFVDENSESDTSIQKKLLPKYLHQLRLLNPTNVATGASLSPQF